MFNIYNRFSSQAHYAKHHQTMRKAAVPIVQKNGIFLSGGPGTYVLLGPTDSGKNFLFEHQMRQAYNTGLEFSSVISYSSTDTFSESLDFVETICDSEWWYRAEQPDEILTAFAIRSAHLTHLSKVGCPIMGRPRTKQEIKEYCSEYPIAVILDDMGGKINLSRSNSEWYNLITTARHLGIYFFILIQYKATVGPGFWTNFRAIISFDRNIDTLKTLAKQAGFSEYKKYETQVSKWLGTHHAFSLWWLSWKIAKNRPEIPWLCSPVTQGKVIDIQSPKNISSSTTKQPTTVPPNRKRKQFV